MKGLAVRLVLFAMGEQIIILRLKFGIQLVTDRQIANDKYIT